MAPFELESLPAKDLARIVRGLVLAVFAVGGISGTGLLRVDKFGASDAEQLKREVVDTAVVKALAACSARMDNVERDLKFQMQVEHNNLKDNVPTESEKKRIRAVERFLEKNLDYEVPTHEWD